MPDISALYPQPQPQQQNFLSGNPIQTIGALGELQKIGILNQQAPALGQIPGQELTNLQTQNANAQMQMQSDVLQRARAAYGTAFGSRKDPVSENEIHNFTTNYARQNPVDAQRFPGVLNSVASDVLSNPNSGQTDTAGIPQRARTLLSLSVPSIAAATPTSGPPGLGGTPTNQSTASAIQSGSYATGQPVGEEIRQKTAAQQAADFETQAAQYGTVSGNLNQLKQDSQVLGQVGGSTLPLERTLGAIAQRIGAPDLATLTPDQLSAADSFDKIINIMSAGPASIMANAGNTDQARTMTLHSNPNSQMTQQSREMLIDMVGGNQDYIQHLAKVWQKARSGMDENGNPLMDENGQPTGKLPANSFNDFVREATTKPLNANGATMDPRVFWFDRMDRPNQQRFLSQLSPSAAQQFETNLEEANKRGWVAPPKSANAAQ